jgi:hypothetical protein
MGMPRLVIRCILMTPEIRSVLDAAARRFEDRFGENQNLLRAYLIESLGSMYKQEYQRFLEPLVDEYLAG